MQAMDSRCRAKTPRMSDEVIAPDGIESALRQAKEAARGKDVRIGGGVATIRQYLTAGMID